MIGTLDRDIVAALDAAGLRAVRVKEVSTLRAAALRRSALRIDLESGETVKARRLEDEDTARLLFELRQYLPEAFVPAFSCRGPVLLERWVDGEVIGHTQPGEAHLREAGRLLTGVHAIPVVAGQPMHQRESTAAWRNEAEQSLAMIVAAGEFDAQEAQRVREMLARLDPGRAPVGLTHVDFCGENMLIDRGHRLRVFDNDRVRIGPLGFDLARARYRWALEPAAWTCFRDAYAGGPWSAEALGTLGFWEVMAVVKSAIFRLRTDPALVRIPATRLRQLAHGQGLGGGQ